MKHRTNYAASLGALLLASETTYAGQGYCFALARVANEESTLLLTEYVDVYLREPDKWYDQSGALGALSWVDRIRGTNSASRFLEPSGLWDSFNVGRSRSWPGGKTRMRFAQLMEFTATAFDE